MLLVRVRVLLFASAYVVTSTQRELKEPAKALAACEQSLQVRESIHVSRISTHLSSFVFLLWQNNVLAETLFVKVRAGS